jgi:hypothetical protein
MDTEVMMFFQWRSKNIFDLGPLFSAKEAAPGDDARRKGSG